MLLPFCSNIIDVSAADQQQMEQHEYMDRARQYRCAGPGQGEGEGWLCLGGAGGGLLHLSQAAWL